MKRDATSPKRPETPPCGADLSARPSEEAITLRAYERFRARGCVSGDPVDDWAEAEQELLAERRKPRPSREEADQRDELRPRPLAMCFEAGDGI